MKNSLWKLDKKQKKCHLLNVELLFLLLKVLLYSLGGKLTLRISQTCYKSLRIMSKHLYSSYKQPCSFLLGYLLWDIDKKRTKLWKDIMWIYIIELSRYKWMCPSLHVLGRAGIHKGLSSTGQTPGVCL